MRMMDYGGNNNASGGSGSNSGGEKRYCCPACPYATDRRDLFTRHENIHRDEKPFQCYVCAKQFNRADHVKKHFLRMHRDHPYDLNKIRRSPPKNASGMSFYHKYNGGSGSGSEGTPQESSGTTTPGATNGNANNNRNVLQQPSHLQAPSLIPAPLAASLMHTNHHSHIGNSPQNHQQLGLHSTGNNYQVSGTGKMGGGGKRNHHNGMKGNVLSGNGAEPGTGKPKKPKKVGDKRYSCCYCAWSGADNWCLKRHLNTHIKPFLCPLCDYKAARSERLATHVLKVHNKRACAKCAFLGDDQLALSEHVQEHHPTEIKNTNRTSNNTLLRNMAFPCYQPAMSSSFCEAGRGHRTLSDSTLIYRYNGRGRNNINRGGLSWRRGYSSQLGGRSWGPARNHPFSTSPRGKWCGGPLVRGCGKKAAQGRGGSTAIGAGKGSLILKVGASGGGGGATVTLRGAEGRRLSQCAVCSFRSADERSMADHLRIRHGLPHRWGDTVRELRPFNSDQNTCPTTGVAGKLNRMVVNLDDEDEEEDEEESEANKHRRRWPPYECRLCGCEFANKWSLENHIAMHHKSASIQELTRFVKASGERHPYICSVCGLATASQAAMMRHLRFHSGLSLRCKAGGGCIYETTSEAALVEHVRSSHDDKDFTARCPHCGHGSSTPAAYARHSAIHHPAALSSNGRHSGNMTPKVSDPDVEEVIPVPQKEKDEQPCKMCAEVFLKHFFLPLEKLHSNGVGNGHVPNKNNNELINHGQKLPNGLLDAVIGGLSEVATPVNVTETSNPKSSEWAASMEEASRLRRSRKQSRPRKLVMTALDPSEIQVLNEPMKRRRKRRWRKRRRKRMAERMKWLRSLQEAEMQMPRIRVARRFPESLRGLRDKYVQRRKLGRASRWWRGPFHCEWCQEAGVTFRTRAGLALHDLWRHLRGASCQPPARIGRFECGQCGCRFPHQYKVVLHAGRVHVGNVNLEENYNKLAHDGLASSVCIDGSSASLGILESMNSSCHTPQVGSSSPPPPPAPHLNKCEFPPHIQSSSPIPLSIEVNPNYASPSVPVATVVSALASS